MRGDVQGAVQGAPEDEAMHGMLQAVPRLGASRDFGNEEMCPRLELCSRPYRALLFGALSYFGHEIRSIWDDEGIVSLVRDKAFVFGKAKAYTKSFNSSK
ncbi:hypothetical protein NL676_006133 [Syzygium grande]|nr:hypothetical protein NL676_006133 [Syzygium grande]